MWRLWCVLNVARAACPEEPYAPRPFPRTLFTPLVRDGAGSLVATLIAQARYAAARNLRWGGAIATTRSSYALLRRPAADQPHHVDPRRAIRFVFGRDVVKERLHTKDDAVTILDPDALASLSVPRLKKNVFFANAHAPLPRLSRTSGAAFDARLRRGAACRVRERVHLFQRPRARTVAAHLRRGDVVATMTSRWVSAECLVETLAWIRSLSNATVDVDAHVFSSTSKDVFRKHEWTAADFAPLDGAGYAVHLADDTYGGDQTDATLDHWAHMAAADVLLVGASNFSHVPAALNGGCVLMLAEDDMCYARTRANADCVTALGSDS